jgi:hypothetical protein
MFLSICPRVEKTKPHQSKHSEAIPISQEVVHCIFKNILQEKKKR